MAFIHIHMHICRSGDVCIFVFIYVYILHAHARTINQSNKQNKHITKSLVSPSVNLRRKIRSRYPSQIVPERGKSTHARIPRGVTMATGTGRLRILGDGFRRRGKREIRGKSTIVLGILGFCFGRWIEGQLNPYAFMVFLGPVRPRLGSRFLFVFLLCFLCFVFLFDLLFYLFFSTICSFLSFSMFSQFIISIFPLSYVDFFLQSFLSIVSVPPGSGVYSAGVYATEVLLQFDGSLHRLSAA